MGSPGMSCGGVVLSSDQSRPFLEMSDSVSDASTGVLRLGPMLAGDQGFSFGGWIGRGGVQTDGRGRIHYLLNRAADSILRPHEPLDGVPVPVEVPDQLSVTGL